MILKKEKHNKKQVKENIYDYKKVRTRKTKIQKTRFTSKAKIYWGIKSLEEKNSINEEKLNEKENELQESEEVMFESIVQQYDLIDKIKSLNKESNEKDLKLAKLQEKTKRCEERVNHLSTKN